MSRHPYTHACDLIRCVAGHNREGSKLSRSDASQIRQLFAEVLGMNDEELATKLSLHYQKHESRYVEMATKDMVLIWADRLGLEKPR
jgi:hypothetical protein